MRPNDLNEATNPGAAPGEPSVIAEEAIEPDEDEFPSEATRIDPSFLGASAPSRPKAVTGSLEALAAARAQSRQEAPAQRERPAPVAPRNNKLAALKSLSLDGGASSARLPPTPRQHGGSKLPWVLLLLLGAGFGGKAAWEKYHAPVVRSDQPAIRLETVQSSGGSGETHIAAGFTAARDPISVGVSQGGLVKEVRVQNNDPVTKGETIVNMDASAAEAELSAVHIEISEMERAYAQQMMLFKNGAATVVQVSQAKSAVAMARAKARAPEQKIAQAHVRALTSGTVLEVLVHPGETVPANGPAVKIADLHNLVAEVDINEADIVKIHHGQQVDVTSDALPGKSFKGIVGLIREQVDKARGTLGVRVDLKITDDDPLRPGMSVKCTFLPMKGEAPRIFVSRSAVTPQGTVYVVSDHRATSRPVKIGMAQGPSVEIVSGVTAGEQIVSDAQKVHDGQQLPP